MSQIAFGFDHERLLDVLTKSSQCEKVVMSLCNLKRPTTGVTSMHIAAHFFDAQDKVLSDTLFEVGCPFPPGWDAADHHPNNPPGGPYVVNFNELTRTPKFSISKQKLLNILKSNGFKEEPNGRKQLLATIEGTNGTSPLKTFIRFMTNPGDFAKAAEIDTEPFAV